MIKCRGRWFRDEDEPYEEMVQRQIDDERESEMTRTAAGISKEELSLEQARDAGRAVGLRGGSASLNPYQEGFPEYKEWERARLDGLAFSIGGITCR